MNNRTYFEDTKALWIVIFIIFYGCNFQSNAQQTLQKPNQPEGFTIEIYADDVPNARQLTLGETDIVYMGSRSAGKIYVITDNDNGFQADNGYTVAEDLCLSRWKFIDFGPPSYQNKIQIAEHGSWNRNEKIGYRITEVTLKNEQTTSYESFIDGWLQENDAVWGRPVDFFNYPTAQYSSPTIKTAPFITLLIT